MTLPGSIGSGAPRRWDDLPRRLQALERRVNQLMTQRSLESAQIGRGGITVTDDGSIRVVDADGHTVCVIGSLPEPYNRDDGTSQPGFAIYRENGSLAALLGDLNPTVPPYRQALQILDRAGNVVLADDTNGTAGLAVPWVGLDRPADTNIATWPGTAETDWTTISTCYLQRQNPGIRWSLYSVADELDTVGQVRVTIDGEVIATSPDVTDFAVWSSSYYWSPGWTFQSTASFAVEAIRTAGTGNVKATCLQLTGVQT